MALAEEDLSGPRAELTDYVKLQIRRNYLEKWLHEPFFDQVVKGLFVRIFIGPMDGVAVYRMCEVVDVVPYKRSYKLPGTDIVTDKAFIVCVGKKQTTVKLLQLSSSRITERELSFFETSIRDQRLTLMSKKVCVCVYACVY